MRFPSPCYGGSFRARRRRGKPTPGTVRLRAEHRGGAVWIHVEDDGGGIDPERVRAAAIRRGLVPPEVARRLSEAEARELIYLPGLSTAPGVTTASGRGVGLDVVRAGLARLHGEIAVASTPGLGTTFTLKLPLTVDLAVTDTMPAIKGATAQAQLKPATTETGQQVMVPSYIEPGERIRVDTRDGRFVERAK